MILCWTATDGSLPIANEKHQGDISSADDGKENGSLSQVEYRKRSPAFSAMATPRVLVQRVETCPNWTDKEEAWAELAPASIFVFLLKSRLIARASVRSRVCGIATVEFSLQRAVCVIL